MSQIQKKFIKDGAVDGAKILVLNDQAIKARNAGDSADVSLFKLDGADKLQFLTLPQVGSDPVAGNDIVRKSHLDSELASAAADVTALEGRVTAIEDDYGVAGGLATLDGAGLVPSSQLPSYVDDVLEFANLAAFPATGETGKIYVAIDTSKCYRWSGSTYIYITSGAVDSVNSQTGVVELTGSDIPLSSPVMAQTDVQAALSALEAEDLTFLKLDGTRAMTAPLAMGTFDITDAANIDALSLNVNGAAATSIVSATSITLDAPIVEVATSLTTEKVEGGLYSLESGVGLSLTDVSSVVSVGAGAAILSGDTLAFSSGAVSGLAALIGADPADKAAPKGYVDQEVLTEKNRAEAAEGVLQGLIDALEASSVEFVQEKFVLAAGDISNGYVTLSNLAIASSINAFVDRLAIHATDDYTLSTVGGVTRITFAGSLITPGQEKLSAGDVVRVKYAKVAIV